MEEFKEYLTQMNKFTMLFHQKKVFVLANDCSFLVDHVTNREIGEKINSWPYYKIVNSAHYSLLSEEDQKLAKNGCFCVIDGTYKPDRFKIQNTFKFSLLC